MSPEILKAKSNLNNHKMQDSFKQFNKTKMTIYGLDNFTTQEKTLKIARDRIDF